MAAPFSQLRPGDAFKDIRARHISEGNPGSKLAVINLDIDNAVQDESSRLVRILDTLLTSLYQLSHFSTSEEGTERKLKDKCDSLRGTSLQFASMLIKHLSMENAALSSRNSGESLIPYIYSSSSALANLLISDNQLSFRFHDCFGNRPDSVEEFLETIANLREIVIANLKRIMSSKPPSNNLLEEAVNREHKENISAKHLKEKIESRKKSSAEILNNKKKYLESLQRQISAIQGKCEETRKKIQTNEELHQQRALPDYEQTKQQLLNTLDTKRSTFAVLKSANRAFEDKLHRRKVSGESEIQKTINDYDSKMIQIYGEVNDLRNDLELKKERVRFLTSHFQRLDEARAARAERKRLEMIRKHKLNHNLRIWFYSSLILQRHIRLVNKLYGKKGKKGGKKKK